MLNHKKNNKGHWNFSFLGKIDIIKIRETISKYDHLFSISHKDVSNNTDNQSRPYDTHQHVQHIHLFREDNITYPKRVNKYNAQLYDMLKTELDEVVDLAKKFYGNNQLVVTRMLFAKLKANSVIPKHHDNGIVLEYGHRIHLPIVTNPKVYFSVGRRTMNMLSGDMYEINNTRTHHVENNSDQDRIHRIMDLFDLSLVEKIVISTPTLTLPLTPISTPLYTLTNSPTSTSTLTNSPTSTSTSTLTNSPTSTPTLTNSPTSTPTLINTPTSTPTLTLPLTPVSTPSPSPPATGIDLIIQQPISSNHPRLNLLILGEQKCGTMALKHNLNKHPDVNIIIREMHVFDQNRHPRCYRRLIRKDKAYNGEGTPIYFYDPNCIFRINRYNPEMKILVILRDPVSRALSSYNMFCKKGAETRSFKQAVKEEIDHLDQPTNKSWPMASRHYVRRGFYIDSLIHLYQHVAKEQIHVIISENIWSNPERELRKIYQFLNVEPINITYESVHVMQYDRTIEPSLKQQLSQLYHPKNAELEQLLGIKLPWQLPS